MKVKFRKQMNCDNPILCTQQIKKKLIEKFGTGWDEVKKKSSYHFSILHENNNHTFWLFFYDKDGIHESERHGKTITEKSYKVIKYLGVIPTQKEIEALL